ncbi:DUF4174 domain-containing protein [Paracoccus pacificus]|uniref:DUF4174 domain-containing protein n=1 Tax=Paracoccus pacificus TaxID=1463598 RepID=A0ABW4R438_9RHOB
MRISSLFLVVAALAVSGMGSLAPVGGNPETAALPPSTREPAPAPPPAPAPKGVQSFAADDVDPAEFLWKLRPLVVFADTADDPAYVQQMAAILRDPGPLAVRDVVVITDTDPSTSSLWRTMLNPQGFSLVLLDKDGQVKLRKPLPWDVREISRAIDKFPLRRQEIGRAGLTP